MLQPLFAALALAAAPAPAAPLTGHMEGAVSLPLPEFSDERLAEVVGRADRPILIYCNNNFRDDRPPVMLKSGGSRSTFPLSPTSTAMATATSAS
jgi:hypothetical protein